MEKEDLFNLLRTTQDQNILWMYLLQNDYNYNYFISLNENCPLEILKILIKNNNNWLIKGNIAQHSNCPTDLLKHLSKDKDSYVRLKVIEHSNCSITLLEKLTKDEDRIVRTVAQRKLNEKNRAP